MSVTITPVMAFYLLPKMKRMGHGDSPLVVRLKRWDAALLHWSFGRTRTLLVGALVAVVLAAATIPLFPRAFLPAPPF